MSGEINNTFDLAEIDKDPLSKWEETSDSSEELNGLLLHDDPGAVLADGTQQIVSLLKSASALRELDLSARQTPVGGKLNSYDRIFESIAHEVHLPRLEKCALLGFMAKGESILLFLQKYPSLHSFTWQECRLTTGSWTPIVPHLDQSMPELENLNLSTLCGKHLQNFEYAPSVAPVGSNTTEQQQEEAKLEVDGLVNLQLVWETDHPPRWTSFSAHGGKYVHTRGFTREELKKGLVFEPLRRDRGRAEGSMELMLWRKTRNTFYKPP
ncbi:hypothetical protein BDV38DRAFT_279793 [Aspergillus pseudotamarii]|uniref:Uncharacterized protein n=1 Tax=Aspergillus pseudotamarii TaxID=132259 RepID=A0A5N6T3D8_ASPPS|nr:uncharacterized protein BDV38DRAFT_279793 [Aspergillus pseudotamarii]KAE8140820.1 hypothetical protein BDV38DRAFT_279793 [Aspergillus pseudotamarii]